MLMNILGSIIGIIVGCIGIYCLLLLLYYWGEWNGEGKPMIKRIPKKGEYFIRFCGKSQVGSASLVDILLYDGKGEKRYYQWEADFLDGLSLGEEIKVKIGKDKISKA